MKGNNETRCYHPTQPQDRRRRILYCGRLGAWHLEFPTPSGYSLHLYPCEEHKGDPCYVKPGTKEIVKVVEAPSKVERLTYV